MSAIPWPAITGIQGVSTRDGTHWLTGDLSAIARLATLFEVQEPGGEWLLASDPTVRWPFDIPLHRMRLTLTEGKLLIRRDEDALEFGADRVHHAVMAVNLRRLIERSRVEPNPVLGLNPFPDHPLLAPTSEDLTIEVVASD